MVCLFLILFCIIHSAFKNIGFPNFMFKPFFNERDMCSGEIALKNVHYYYYIPKTLLEFVVKCIIL